MGFKLKLIRNALFIFLFSVFWLNPFLTGQLFAAPATSFSVYSFTVAEDAGTATITVNRNGGGNGAVAVNYATSNGTAKDGSDYTAASGTLDFADGELTKTFTVPILDDDISEPTETVKITLSRPTGGATLGAQKKAVLKITDDDASNGQFEFSNVSYTAAEGAGTATITVSRNGGDNGAASVNYATSNGTAKDGSDYAAAGGTLDFADGESTKTFTVTILDDGVSEPTETVKLTLSRPTGGATLGSQKTAVLRITNNDDSNGEIEFSNVSYTAAEDAGTATITVSRNGGDNGAVAVQYATGNGTAKDGSDYAAASGALDFADGEPTKTFTIPILDDDISEPTETVKLTLSRPTGGATLGAQKKAVLNIADDDAPNGQFEFSDAAYTVAEDAGTATITVSRNGGANGAVAVNYATSNGTAINGLDYTAAGGTLNFADGELTKTFTVPILDDGMNEPTETVKLTLRGPAGGATLGVQNTAVLNITSDDTKGQFEFSDAAYAVAEDAGTATITVSRNGGGDGAVTVQYATSNGTARDGLDYTAASGALDFADGELTETFTVPILDDTESEIIKTVKLTLSGPAGGATLGSQKTAVLNIADNDAPNGQFEFSDAAYTVAENGGTVAAAVYRNGGSNGAVTVQYATSNGTAKDGLDYTAASGTLNFADGELTKTFTVYILDDGMNEPTETVKLTLRGPAGGATLGVQNTAVLNIANDDTKGQFEFSDAAYAVAEDAGTAAITVSRNGGGDGAAAVNYATGNGTARDGLDYTAAGGTLDFADGELTKTFTVPILDDTESEIIETVKLSLSGPAGGATLGSQKTAVLNIADNDAPNGQFEFSDAAYTVAENAGTVTAAVYRNGGSNGAVTVQYATSNGTAKDGLDYTAAGGTLDFADGELTKTFPVPILDDAMNEPTETVKLTLRRPTGGATLGVQNTAVLNITSDDTRGQFEFSDAVYTVAENAGTVTAAVYRNGGSNGAVTVNYATSNGMARDGLDYTAASGTLDFADGELTKTFTVPILDDGINEPTETVKLTLSGPAGGATLGSQKTAVLNIVDNDAPNGQFEFSDAAYTVAENARTVTAAVYRNGGSNGAVTVQYATSNGTAINGLDYTAAGGTLDFADGELTKTFTVPILDDGINEPTETVKLTLSNPAGGASLGVQKTAVLRITNDDPSNGEIEF